MDKELQEAFVNVLKRMYGSHGDPDKVHEIVSHLLMSEIEHHNRLAVIDKLMKESKS